MKFLICGCNGMAGHIISLYLKEQGHDVFGFDLKESKYINSVAGDACDKEFVTKLINNGNFDIIVNCIGILNEAAEKNKALSVYLNSYFPHFLAQLTQNSKTKIIHMSTDCVFSGKKGNYLYNDFRDGETFYDRTKALGELEDNKNITLRNSIVGPDINENGIGLFNWFMKQKTDINGYTNVLWTGQTTLQLAKTIEKVALNDAYGLYNSVPEKPISKYELLKLFNDYIKCDKIKINPYDDVRIDKSLVSTKFEFDYSIPEYKTMVIEMGEWIRNHKELYPHYEVKK